jgi:hypothetical protein
LPFFDDDDQCCGFGEISFEIFIRGTSSSLLGLPPINFLAGFYDPLMFLVFISLDIFVITLNSLLGLFLVPLFLGGSSPSFVCIFLNPYLIIWTFKV